mgnify:CR=1 FL=1
MSNFERNTLGGEDQKSDAVSSGSLHGGDEVGELGIKLAVRLRKVVGQSEVSVAEGDKRGG